MRWNEFLNIAYPANMRERELSRGIFWKTNRWLGVRIAYPLCIFGVTANVLDFLRVVMSVLAFYFLSKLRAGDVFSALLGIFLLYLQVFLDFVDGVVARVLVTSGNLGEMWDGLPNALSRSVVLIMFGIFTRNIFFIMLSASASYVLINFMPETLKSLPSIGLFEPVKNIFNKILSVVVMLIILPLLAVLWVLWGYSLTGFSYFVSGSYICLALLWLGVCVLKK